MHPFEDWWLASDAIFEDVEKSCVDYALRQKLDLGPVIRTKIISRLMLISNSLN